MSLLEKRKQYLANAFVLVAKLHNLHWNVEGTEFVQIHEYTERLYDSFFEKFDAIAEAMKMEGEFPPVRTCEYGDLATIEQLDSKAFSPIEVLEIVKKDLCAMKTLATEIRNEADKEGNFLLVAAMEEDVAQYTKDLWFLKAMLSENKCCHKK